jgi:hypothetical protein
MLSFDFDERKVSMMIQDCLKVWEHREEGVEAISFGYSRSWGSEAERKAVDQSLRRVGRMRFG